LHLDGSPHVIRLQRSLYGTSMPGAGAVHHIKTGKAQIEHMFSGLPPATDIRQRGWHVGSVPQADIAPSGQDSKCGASVDGAGRDLDRFAST
jgi:hypothetical protein